jgi:hypothetical protein
LHHDIIVPAAPHCKAKPRERSILRDVNTIRIGAAAADHKKPLAATSRDHKSDAGAEDIPMRSGL